MLCQPIAKDLLKYPAPDTPTQGKFSMNYCIACAMVYGSPGLSISREMPIEDERVKALMSRIDMEVCPEIAGGRLFQRNLGDLGACDAEGRTHWGEKDSICPGRSGEPPEQGADGRKVPRVRIDCHAAAYVERVSQALERLDELENITELSGLVNQGTKINLNAEREDKWKQKGFWTE